MEIEYAGKGIAFIGILGFLGWLLFFFPIFKKPNLIVPNLSKNKFALLIRIAFLFLGIFAWANIIYSMMLPRLPMGRTNSKIEINDIYLVVDCSRSMLADDFHPNRFEVAKKKIIEFVELRPTDRVGIITFAEKVFTLLPLSTDIELVRRVVPEINMGLLGNGTNIGDALGLAVARLVSSPAKTKIIVLLTDGVSNVGNLTPLQSAEEAKKNNIKVYTIGIGTDERARIPSFRPGQMQNIPGGSIDVETLNQISVMTNAKFYYAKDDSSLGQILKDINELEKTEIEKSGTVIYKDLYYKYLKIGFVLLLLIELFKSLIFRFQL